MHNKNLVPSRTLHYQTEFLSSLFSRVVGLSVYPSILVRAGGRRGAGSTRVTKHQISPELESEKRGRGQPEWDAEGVPNAGVVLSSKNHGHGPQMLLLEIFLANSVHLGCR